MLSDADEAIVKDLMTALLAVNQWSVERVFIVVQQFEAVGLLRLDELRKMQLSAVADRLREAGYHRGDFMCTLMAPRVLSAAKALTTGGLELLRDQNRGKDDAAVTKFLLSIYGAGPQVVQTFLALRERTT